jgi:hypothetical protein
MEQCVDRGRIARGQGGADQESLCPRHRQEPEAAAPTMPAVSATPIVTSARDVKINETEEDGNRWKNMEVSSPGFDLFLVSRKKTLWQASTEDQLRNFGMPSFVTVKDV